MEYAVREPTDFPCPRVPEGMSQPRSDFLEMVNRMAQQGWEYVGPATYETWTGYLFRKD